MYSSERLFNGMGWLIFIPLILLFPIINGSTATTKIKGENGHTSLLDPLSDVQSLRDPTKVFFYNRACKSKVCINLETSGPVLYMASVFASIL